jgi:outer membrane protein OmpA-like peptidoglycan-associated protein
MKKLTVAVAALVALAGVQPVAAQRPLSIDVGAFGQYNIHDDELNLENGLSVGGRLALYLISNFAIEADINYGKTDWENNGTTTSLTYRPWALRLLWSLPLNPSSRFVFGAGYTQLVYEGRTREITQGNVQRNEYEDAFAGLVGFKSCIGDKWHWRVDGLVNHAPSPNFTGGPELDGKATSWGVRAGVGRMLRGDCLTTPFSWSLALVPPSSQLRVGATQPLTVNARDGDGNVIDMSRIRNYRCTSDNPNVATVDNNGVVTAVGPGTATITCTGTVNGQIQSATHTVTVRRTDWRLTVTGGGTFPVGQGTTVSASAVDEDNRPVTGAVTWTSSNPSVATVDANGNVRCVAAGTVTITGTMTRDGETRTGTVQVTCTAPPPPPRAQLVAQLTDVHFGFNRHDLTRAGRDTLNWVIGQLNSSAGSTWVISVEGHTDPYGSDAYNDALANRRAQTVYDYLTSNGVAASRIAGQRGFGERCLLLQDDHDRPQRSRAEHVENRRVEIWNLNGTQLPTGCRPASDYQNR